MTIPNYDHDRPDSLSEYEYTEDFGVFRVRVSKVGGGTIGRKYDGSWHYAVEVPDSASIGVTEGSDLTTGTPVDHRTAAAMVAEYFDEDN